ncbi:MAG TPA: hypothetical protein VFP31_12280 [Gaiellaceae bacterium]|nr:hypothetical protein [Gaiellaceae bacterium]
MRAWPTGGLWRHADFLRLWGAQTVSQFGSQITLLALPLAAIVTLDATPFEVALLGALATSFSLRTAIWVSAAGNALSWLPLVIGPVKSLREVPEIEQEPPLGESEAQALFPGPPLPDEP